MLFERKQSVFEVYVKYLWKWIFNYNWLRIKTIRSEGNDRVLKLKFHNWLAANTGFLFLCFFNVEMWLFFSEYVGTITELRGMSILNRTISVLNIIWIILRVFERLHSLLVGSVRSIFVILWLIIECVCLMREGMFYFDWCCDVNNIHVYQIVNV